jgi:hypothetical protein
MERAVLAVEGLDPAETTPPRPAGLAGRAGSPSIRGMLVVKITSASSDLPLYEVQAEGQARARQRG